MNQGDVFLAMYPFTDQSTQKLRPVVVISRSEFNQQDDVVVLPISSSPSSASRKDVVAVPDSHSDFVATGLRCTSFVKWTKPLSLHKGVFIRRLGKLPDGIMSEVCERCCRMCSKEP